MWKNSAVCLDAVEIVRKNDNGGPGPGDAGGIEEHDLFHVSMQRVYRLIDVLTPHRCTRTRTHKIDIDVCAYICVNTSAQTCFCFPGQGSATTKKCHAFDFPWCGFFWFSISSTHLPKKLQFSVSFRKWESVEHSTNVHALCLAPLFNCRKPSAHIHLQRLPFQEALLRTTADSAGQNARLTHKRNGSA